MQNLHKPVLIKPILEKLDFFWGEDYQERVVFDGTFGGGGYSCEFLKRKAKVFASDRDEMAVDQALLNFDKEVNKNQLVLYEASFNNCIKEFSQDFFDLIVLDLGFSSNQLEYSEKGFSFQKLEDEFDLRYSQKEGLPCWKKIKNLKFPSDLKRIIYTNSGEPSSKRIAEIIYKTIRAKKNTEVTTVGDIIDALDKEILGNKPVKLRLKTLSRVWQALRIWTNQEIDILESFLIQSFNKLKPKGLLMVVSFHSLEDKIVASQMRRVARPVDIDNFGTKKSNFKLLTKDSIKPTEGEIYSNNRARSAMLRILQRV